MSNTNGYQAGKSRRAISVLTPERAGLAASRGERWSGQPSSYYNIPLIHKAHWGWEIILYFFLGGLAGGSYLASTLAHLFGSREDAGLIRTGPH